MELEQIDRWKESGIGTERAAFSTTVHHSNIPINTEGMEMILVFL